MQNPTAAKEEIEASIWTVRPLDTEQTVPQNDTAQNDNFTEDAIHESNLDTSAPQPKLDTPHPRVCPGTFTGITIDQISKVSSKMFDMPSNPGYFINDWMGLAIIDFHNMEVGTLHPTFLYHVSNINPIEAFWRTLIRNQDDEGNVPENLHLEKSWFGSWYAACVRAIGGNWQDWDIDDKVPGSPVRAFERWVRRASVGKMFLRGEKNFVGTVEGVAKVGDVICVFKDCEGPVILRRIGSGDDEEEKWTLVGEAYVYGIMDGEAWGLGLDERAFVIV